MLCRLYDCGLPAIAEIWHIGLYEVFQARALLEAGDFVIRHNQRMRAKHLDPWSASFIVQARVGRSRVNI